MIRFFGILLIFLPFTQSLFSQEKMDSTSFDPAYRPQLMIPFMFDASFSKQYPLSGDFNVNSLMKNQIFDYGVEDLDQYHFYASAENSFYQYSSNGYSFWQNTTPLAFGFSYHLKDAFGWDKLDLFIDGAGVMIQDYSDVIQGASLQSNPAFIWELGAGIGYEIAPGSTIFIKSSIQFKNASPFGSRNLGGMHMKF